MKAMFIAFAACLMIAVAAPVVLNQFGWSSAEQTSSSKARLD